MKEPLKVKSIVWIGSSRRDLKSFPAEVKDVMGYALYEAQRGLKSPLAKPLAGFGGASVLEIVEDYQTDAYRAVYTVRFSDLIYIFARLSKEIQERRRDAKARCRPHKETVTSRRRALQNAHSSARG